MQYRVHANNTIREDRAGMIFEIAWCLAMHLPAHLADRSFADIFAAPMVDELLNSIYTFGLERVLSVMLLQRLSENPSQALDLLAPNHPVRATYLAFIQRELTKTSSISPVSQPKHQAGFFERLLSRLRRKAL
jgi:hypothetical protein